MGGGDGLAEPTAAGPLRLEGCESEPAATLGVGETPGSPPEGRYPGWKLSSQEREKTQSAQGY